jgi:hypothetical protein
VSELDEAVQREARELARARAELDSLRRKGGLAALASELTASEAQALALERQAEALAREIKALGELEARALQALQALLALPD